MKPSQSEFTEPVRRKLDKPVSAGIRVLAQRHIHEMSAVDLQAISNACGVELKKRKAV